MRQCEALLLKYAAWKMCMHGECCQTPLTHPLDL